MNLWHITSLDAWEAAQRDGAYRPRSLETEGFIHLSEDRQWLKTANRFYRGQAGLVILRIREALLGAEVKREPADGDHFPHLFGPLNLDAVDAVFDLQFSENRSSTMSGELSNVFDFSLILLERSSKSCPV